MTARARSPTVAVVDSKESEMPKSSRESAALDVYPAAEDRHAEIGGYTVNFVSIREDSDLAPALAGLPDGRCQCPHWGYVFEGRLTFTFADRQEVYEAGDAFHTPAGHTPRADAGTSLVQFSPTDLFETTQAAIAESMRAAQQG
jgi:mannose-6-phosphate isomerase-like protein (cupin superfamily)